MNRTTLTLSIALVFQGCLASPTGTWAGEWMTYRSTYTHDAYGQRVDQHTRPVEPLSPDQGNLVRSGYRHYRSTIQGSTTADNLHMTYEWGRPVMPYEHWRFPFRPYGSPYDQWGPPVPNVLSNINVQGGYPGNYPGHPNGVPGNFTGNVPGNAYPNNNYPGNNYPGNIPGGQPYPNIPGNNNGPNGFYPSYPPGVPGYPGGNYGPNPSAPWIDGLYPSAPPLR